MAKHRVVDKHTRLALSATADEGSHCRTTECYRLRLLSNRCRIEYSLEPLKLSIQHSVEHSVKRSVECSVEALRQHRQRADSVRSPTRLEKYAREPALCVKD